MHTAEQLRSESFQIEIDGKEAGLSDLFVDANPLDRFGIVVTEPLGGLGASLLIQAASLAHFEVRPERRDDRPAYPEIYAFHFGGRQGDLTWFDFWPPRKEVFVEDAEPIALLGEINARGITRLAIPGGAPGDPQRLTFGPNTWAEQAAARDRIRQCFVYSASGRVEGDVCISSADPKLEEDARMALDPIATVAALEKEDPWLVGDDVPDDLARFLASVRAREGEVPSAVLDRLADQRRAAAERADGRRLETFRRIDVNAALALIAGVDGVPA